MHSFTTEVFRDEWGDDQTKRSPGIPRGPVGLGEHGILKNY